MVSNDVGGKIWSAIVALGVMDEEGKNKLVRRIEVLENGDVDRRDGRKEIGLKLNGRKVGIMLSMFILLASWKKKLWEDLLELKEKFKDREWIIGGDFNAVNNSRERKGRSEWGWQVDESYRYLLADVVVTRWGVVGQFIGERDISNHCLVWLVVDEVDWGLKLFKFNNEWFSFDSFFYPFVEKEWKSFVVEGRGDYVLKEKLRLLKFKLKWWNMEVFGRHDLEVDEGVRNINMEDDRVEEADGNLLLGVVEKRREATSRFWRNLRIKENMLLQKSRLRWPKEEDTNSDFFHKVIKGRRRINHIGPLQSSRGVIDGVEEVKEEVFRHFSSKFEETDEVRPSLDGINFNKIREVDVNFLERPFLREEIKEATWSCGGSRSPGPNGYSFLFFKKC
ncbi:uncharacterized protein LOC131621996 [Vicia villosa]|uniref:uncharacterized protein LOC131621996 n=1 Tax=Vicia villosa TaxID=3911 RepID=UPI00273B41A2|nr:uncharacterized protein LOC131621996 [Vicia villosa]